MNQAFRQSFLATKSADSAHIGFILLLRDLLHRDLDVYLRRSEHQLEGV